jgi:Domain of unknown function (DUF4281)
METEMNFELIFAVANTAALICWVALIFFPRWPFLLMMMRSGIILALSLAYTVIVLIYFFRVQGGGFSSISEVRTLFMSDPVLVAGWLHYLAFDLFVGLWIVAEAQKIQMSRLIQGPILLLTFMFGPAGLLSFIITRQIFQKSVTTLRGV